MRDYTSNNYCDFFWINDLLELKRNSKNSFATTVKTNNSNNSIDVVNVILFGTIIEVKQIGSKGFVYQVDDGTGVIVCKHNEEQFEDIVGLIEGELCGVSNQNLQLTQCLEQSSTFETSTDDSIFNDRSVQGDECDIDKKNQIMVLQSIWSDIHESFAGLLCQYNIGDVVLILGKLYDYFNINQIYINSIRLIELKEEITKVSLKLEDSGAVMKSKKTEGQSDFEKRLSGLMTFDHIHHLSAARFPPSVNVPKQDSCFQVEEKTQLAATPQLQSTITFDTFNPKI